MDSLANSPGNSSVYGQPAQTSSDDALGIVNKLKDREFQDFQNKANFMSELSLKQDRLRKLYDTTPKPGNGQPENVVLDKDPNAMTGYQKAELGIKQGDQNLESQKIKQQGKLGEEALDIKGKQEALNQQKSDQINAQKQADMERKINEANHKIELTQQKIQQAGENQAAVLAAHKEYQAAVEERHKIEIAQKDSQFKTAQETHNAAIKAMEARLKQGAKSKTTTEVSPDGSKRTSTTVRGDSGTVTGTGRDGKQYQVPADQIEDWNANHAAPGTEIDASAQ